MFEAGTGNVDILKEFGSFLLDVLSSWQTTGKSDSDCTVCKIQFDRDKTVKETKRMVNKNGQ